MKYTTPITETDLHAWLDGQLSEQRRRQVEAWLKDHPEKMQELNDYRQIDRDLQQAFAPVLEEPLPAGLRIRPRRHFYQRMATAAGILFAGILLGWQGNSLMVAESPQQRLRQNLLQPAAFAHVVYSSEIKHPVEVGAEQEAHLVHWLSKRLNTQIKAPNLLQQGYQLVGGRLLPSTNRMAAQFMYQDKTGRRVTLYVRRINDMQADAMFQFTRDGELNTFYWIEGSLGYALSGELDRQVLMSMAETTYRQLSPDN